MKKLLSLLICGSLMYTVNAQTLFSIGKEQVTTPTFLSAFEKNNTAKGSERKKALQEYLDLYMRYRLKVKAAYDAGLDTMALQKAEVKQFHDQLAEQFMLDATTLNELVAEATRRMNTEIKAAQIFIPFAGRKDTADSKIKADQAYQLLINGSPFAKVFKDFSDDSTAGQIGYITAFSLPYLPESTLYELKDGGTAAPIRSSAGYHIFRRISSRPASGSISCAQILLGFPPDANKQEKNATARRADSVYKVLQQGGNFAELAKLLSSDNNSYLQGGELPPFRTGTYDPQFEHAAYAIPADGQISKPVETAFGYHIIKRLKRKTPAEEANDPSWKEKLRQLVLQDSRVEKARDVLVENVIRKNGRQLLVDTDDLFGFTHQNLNSDTVRAANSIQPETVILQTGSRKIDAYEWMRYIKAAEGTLDPADQKKSYAVLLTALSKYEALQCYRENLDAFQPEFTNQVREFQEGNLLFEIMQEQVWEQASRDSAGLKKYFSAHAGEYFWQPSAEAILFTCGDEATANELKQKVQKNPSAWQRITDAMDGRVMADSVKIELTQLPSAGNKKITAGAFTDPTIQADRSLLLAYVLKIYPDKHPRSFEEARGFVLNDYQQFIENKWIDTLKKKYPIILNEKEWATLISEH